METPDARKRKASSIESDQDGLQRVHKFIGYSQWNDMLYPPGAFLSDERVAKAAAYLGFNVENLCDFTLEPFDDVISCFLRSDVAASDHLQQRTRPEQFPRSGVSTTTIHHGYGPGIRRSRSVGSFLDFRELSISNSSSTMKRCRTIEKELRELEKSKPLLSFQSVKSVLDAAQFA